MTSTSSYLPRRAAWAGKMIEDTRQKAVGVAGKPVRVAVGAVTVPIEVARSAFNIFRLTEELLEEVVFLLRSMRPVIEAACKVKGFKAPIICTPEELLEAYRQQQSPA